MMTDPHSQTDMQITLDEIWRFPVKGFVGERLKEIEAVENSLFPHDRAFALTTGHPLTHEKLGEGWLAKRHFMQLISLSTMWRYKICRFVLPLTEPGW